MKGSMLFRLAVAGLICMAAGACNTTGRMDIPPAPTATFFDVDAKYLKPIAFEKAIYRLQRGSVIGHFPHFTVGVGDPEVSGNLCNNKHIAPSHLELNVSNAAADGWISDSGAAFYDVFTSRGFNIVGDPDAIFNQGGDRSKAELLVGARVVDMRGNFCEDHDVWTGQPLDRYSGVGYMRVEWAVFDQLQQKQIAEFETAGIGKRKTPTRTGIADAYIDAFAAASENLAANPDFIETISKTDDDTEGYIVVQPTEGDTIRLPNRIHTAGSFSSRIEGILPSVVTISLGDGHGSGFIVSDDGLIITNYHVVGEKESVNVVLSNEITLPAKVLRRHKLRDVALLKIQISNTTPLPMKPNGVALAQKVFAIGSPRFQSLKNTVSSGIVSAYRPQGQSGVLPLIQADVDIHGGNSGGPLLDDLGNVVGITVSGVGEAGSDYSVGLNFFIPIESALEFLNIELTGSTGS